MRRVVGGRRRAGKGRRRMAQWSHPGSPVCPLPSPSLAASPWARRRGRAVRQRVVVAEEEGEVVAAAVVAVVAAAVVVVVAVAVVPLVGHC